jgi:hypothetical protein
MHPPKRAHGKTKRVLACIIRLSKSWYFLVNRKGYRQTEIVAKLRLQVKNNNSWKSRYLWKKALPDPHFSALRLLGHGLQFYDVRTNAPILKRALYTVHSAGGAATKCTACCTRSGWHGFDMHTTAPSL